MAGRVRRVFRTTTLLLVAASAAVSARARQEPPADVATLLHWTRQALGGDAALSAVTTFIVKGSRTTTPGGPISVDASLELACALPDRFVEHTQHTSSLGPLGMSSMSERRGFNGNDPIDERDSDSPFPTPIVAERHGSAAQDAAKSRARLLILGRRAFIHRVFPLFAESFDGAPLTITAAGRVNGPTGPAYAIGIAATDDIALTAFIDASTHVVVGVTWKDKPIVVMTGTTSAIVRERPGSSGAVTSVGPPPVLPAPPTANMPDVLWQMVVTDYRSDGGLNWPHRFTTSFGGHKYEDLKLGSYKINPEIDPATFRVSK